MQTCRCPQARLQVHRCPQTCRYPQARLQVQPCRCLPQARLQVCRCQQARLQIYTCCPYGLRVRVYAPPTSDTTQPMGSGHPSKASHSQCRPGPKSGVSSPLKIFRTANLFTRTHSVRVPALSARAGGSSTFVHAVSQQLLKQAEIQSFIGNQVLLTPLVLNCQTLPRVSLSQTRRLAADHRYLVPNADRKLAAATSPILGWDGPHWVPSPTYASRCGLDFDACVPLGSARKLCSGDALRPDLPWVLKSLE